MLPFRVYALDPESATGYSIVTEIMDGVEYNNRRPAEPPDPIPANWPKWENLPANQRRPGSKILDPAARTS